MSHTLSVQVLDADGDAVPGAKVEIQIEGIWTGGTLSEYSDSSGHAEFETAADYESHRRLSIEVQGQRFGPYRIGGGAYTVQLD